MKIFIFWAMVTLAASCKKIKQDPVSANYTCRHYTVKNNNSELVVITWYDCNSGAPKDIQFTSGTYNIACGDSVVVWLGNATVTDEGICN